MTALVRVRAGWYETADGTTVVREVRPKQWIVERYRNADSGHLLSYSDFMPTFKAAKRAAAAS